jgi:hypothetical protein
MPEEIKTKIGKVFIKPDIPFINKEFFVPTPKMSNFGGVVGQVVFEATQDSRDKRVKDLSDALATKTKDIVLFTLKEIFNQKLLQANSIKLVDDVSRADQFLELMIARYGFEYNQVSGFIYPSVILNVNLKNSADSVLWTGTYDISKNDGKQLHRQNGLNMIFASEDMLEDFNKNPLLIEETYSKVAEILFNKFAMAVLQ